MSEDKSKLDNLIEQVAKYDEAQQLVDAVKLLLPTYETVVEAPIRAPTHFDGMWFVDFKVPRLETHAVIQWKRVGWAEKFKGYGVSNGKEGGYGEGPDAVFLTLGEAAVAVRRVLFGLHPGHSLGFEDVARAALINAKTFIEDTSISTHSSEGNAKLRCFHCDEFAELKEWPEHGNPECRAKKAMNSILQGLESFRR